MNKEQTAWKQQIIYTDLTALPEDEQREKLNGLRQLVTDASRKYNYQQNWRDYHYTFINERVVNPLAMIAEYIARPEIQTSDLVIFGKDYLSHFVLASVSLHTINEWKAIK